MIEILEAHDIHYTVRYILCHDMYYIQSLEKSTWQSRRRIFIDPFYAECSVLTKEIVPVVAQWHDTRHAHWHDGYPETKQTLISQDATTDNKWQSSIRQLHVCYHQQQQHNNRATAAAVPHRFAWLHRYTELQRSLVARSQVAAQWGHASRLSPLGPYTTNCSPIIIFIRPSDLATLRSRPPLWSDQWCCLPLVGSCRFMCSARWSERAKLRSQTLQVNGLAPVCFRMWRVSSSERAKHHGQLTKWHL